MNFDPINLHWTGHGPNNTISIQRSLYEYLYVIFVKDNNPQIILYTNENDPRGFPLTLERSDCILHIVIVGANTKPIERYFKVHVGSVFAVKYDDMTLTETEL